MEREALDQWEASSISATFGDLDVAASPCGLPPESRGPGFGQQARKEALILLGKWLDIGADVSWVLMKVP